MKISDLKQDNKNFNRGTEKGSRLIRKSLTELGAGRSILIDKDNRIIAGNKTAEGAEEVGIDDVIVVETTGKQLVAVKRTDIDLNTKKGRELALADNVTAKENISYSYEDIISESDKYGIDTSDWGIAPSFEPELTPVIDEKPVTEHDIEKATEKLNARFNPKESTDRMIECPKCGYKFKVK